MNNFSFRVPEKAGGGMPTYQQQQQYPTPGVDTSARLSDSAAQIYQQGADQQAKGLEKLGQGLEQASKAGYDLYTDYQTSKAKDAWLQYKQGAQKLQAQLGSLAGKDAIDESNGVVAQLKSWREQARGEISGKLGSMAAGLFDRAASETDATLDAWATGKVHAEAINYGNATSKANISLAQNQAVADAANPAAFGAQMGVVKAELENMAKRSGYGAEWVQAGLQDMQQKTLTQAISDRIAGEDLGTANNMIKAYGPLLGGNADGLRARAASKGRELEARNRADAARAETEALKGKVNAFNSDTAGMSDAEKLDVLDKTYGGDAKNKKVYRAILDDIAYEAGAKTDLRNKAQAIRLRGIEDRLTEAAKGTPEESFQKTREVVQGLPLEDRPKALKIADNLRAANMYDDGKITQDDPLAKSELATRLASGEDVSVDAEYGSRLSKATREKYKSEAFRSALPSVKTAFEVEAATWMGANKSQAKSALGKGGVGALWTRFLDQTNADEKKDPARLRQEARDFFKSVTLEAGFFGRDKKTIQGLQNIYLDKYDDARPAQGTPEYDHAVQMLKQAGKKPEGMFGRYSDKQLSTAYRLLLQSSPDAGGGE